jgi:probable F420-dependent oxidoreductase
MKIGLFNINMHCCAEPEAMGRVAVAAEQAGFDSVWTGEHVVLPEPQVPPSPVPASTPMLDPAVALSYIAAVTQRVQLGTGIIILPQRNPLVLAKELASVDVVSNGRLIFGIGVGYLDKEFEALGITMDDRANRSLEYMEAMRAIWEMDNPEYHGAYVDFAGVEAHPRPIQARVPMVMGGHSAPAFRRSVTHSQGWYGFALDQDGTRACIDGLAKAGARYERPADLGELEISVTPRKRCTPELVEEFAEMGVDRLILLPRGDTVDDWLAFVDDIGSTVINA